MGLILGGHEIMSYRALTSSGFGWELPELDPSRALEAFHGSGGFILIRHQQGLTPRELMEFAALFGEKRSMQGHNRHHLVSACNGFPSWRNAMWQATSLDILD